ncbi:hypothetical protein LCGC14_0635990 [marine sediment metagenome]|uniref:Uncharacterized protein n=1 Tax=marine sediment metagenome TaxID=412755 RepID=A0A0F9TLZ3_9ZZZZ
MKALLVSEKRHKEWKIFCSKKGISMVDATDTLLELGMKSKDIKSKS